MICIKIPDSIYIAGPMTGYEEYNVPAFDAAERALRQSGWKHINNPGHADHQTYAKGLLEHGDVSSLALYDLTMVLQCKAIFMLRGWEKSTGARAEHAAATWAEMKIFYESIQ